MRSILSADKLRETVILSLFGALMFAMQIALSMLPNIEVVTLLIILVTRKYRLKALTSVYIFVALEIAVFGLGLWVVNYLYIWAVWFAIVMLLRRVNDSVIWAVAAGVFGLLFGTLSSIPYFFISGVGGGIAYIVSGIFPFDILHAVGNFVTVAVLYKPLTAVLDKLK